MSDAVPHDANGIANTLRGRRTVHEFSGAVPPLKEISAAVELARWAPNHYRTEPWHFYVLDRHTAEQVAKLNADLVRARKGETVAAVKLKRWLSMPGWLVVSCESSDDEIRQRENYAACCCAVQNMALYLWERGIGMKWTTGEVTRERAFFDLVGIDHNHVSVVGMFWYGYPATVPTQHRKPVSSILTHVVAPPEDR